MRGPIVVFSIMFLVNFIPKSAKSNGILDSIVYPSLDTDFGYFSVIETKSILNQMDSTILVDNIFFCGLGFLGKGLSYPISISSGITMKEKWSFYLISLSPHLAKNFLRFSTGMDFHFLRKENGSGYLGVSLTYGINRIKARLSDQEYQDYIQEKRITSNNIQFYPDYTDTKIQWFYSFNFGWKVKLFKHFILDPHFCIVYSHNKDLVNYRIAPTYGLGFYYSFSL